MFVAIKPTRRRILSVAFVFVFTIPQTAFAVDREEIIRFVEAEVATELIVSYISDERVELELTIEDVEELERMGVPEPVMHAIRIRMGLVDPEPLPVEPEALAPEGSSIEQAPDETEEGRSNQPVTSPAPFPVYEVGHQSWYGWQILLADLASLGLLFAGAGEGESTLELVGLISWVVAGPVIHATHEDGGSSLISLMVRVGVPVVRTLTGASLASSDGCRWCGLERTAYGLTVGVGVVAALVIDVAVLAWEDDPLSWEYAQAGEMWLSPQFDPDRNTTTLQLGFTW